MLPLLNLAGDGQEHLFRATVETLTQQFHLTADEREEQLPSRTQPIFDNRVGWARTYLVKAGLLEAPRRGYFKITVRGRQVLQAPPARLDAAFLREHYSDFRDFVAPKSTSEESQKGNPDVAAADAVTPEESLEEAYQNLRRAVESDVLARLQSGSPGFFERVVVRLLVAMGYGGTLRDAGAAIGKSGDEGIDGIIKEDRLGLDVVYVQAKKWTDTIVGRPEIQKFAGALQGQRARKGVFITTSSFSADARTFVTHIDSKIVLIDGVQLAQFMFEHNVGVSPASTYEVKKVDADFFEEE
jgi:restriction system protein